jgi:hypothetical protein
MSRCAVVIHGGGAALGVHSTVAIPRSASVAIARSSHPNSNSPSLGSSRDHANSATRTTLSPAAAINSASFAQRSSPQYSG